MWILYAILGAVSKAFASTIRKKLSTMDGAVYVFLSSTLISAVVFALVLAIDGESISTIAKSPASLTVAGLVQIAALRANLYAFKHEELSYITPLFAMTPMYAAIIAFFMLGETPSLTGLAGILAIVVGVYIVTTKKDISVLETIKRVSRNKGARAGMLVPLMYALNSVFNKVAINDGVTPLASVVAISAVMGVFHSHVLVSKVATLKKVATDKSILRLLLLASLLGVGSVGFATLALEDAFASYTLGIRRLDILITILIGWRFMGESDFPRRMTGASVMIAGVLLVSFG